MASRSSIPDVTTLPVGEKKCVELAFRVTPTGQQRPRFANGRAYTPAKTRQAMAEIRSLWQAAGSPVVEGEWFTAHIAAYFLRPKTSRFDYPPRTDVDNIAKLVLDALQGHAFPDDSRCVSLNVSKHWSDIEGVHVNLSW